MTTMKDDDTGQTTSKTSASPTTTNNNFDHVKNTKEPTQSFIILKLSKYKAIEGERKKERTKKEKEDMNETSPFPPEREDKIVFPLQALFPFSLFFFFFFLLIIHFISLLSTCFLKSWLPIPSLFCYHGANHHRMLSDPSSVLEP
jgi:hypothetical protein